MGIEKDVIRIDALDGFPVIDIKWFISGNNMLTRIRLPAWV
jgi:tRNA (Thr-GGU) A37 N-methylase